MNECGYCRERDSKLESYEEDIEKEQTRECLMALERQKIATGMNCTRIDEIELRKVQKMQMQEKKFIEKNQEEIDALWHQVLINDVMMKEEKERAREEKLKQEMRERRMAYDDQIASANRKRQDILHSEREKENRRLDEIKKRMERDYYDAFKRKKDQHSINKQNYIEGHKLKLSRIKAEKRQEREIDTTAIKIAIEELQREKQLKLNQIQMLKKGKEIFIENFNREKKMDDELVMEANRIAAEWKQQSENKKDELFNKTVEEKKTNKLKAVQEYKWHIEKSKHEEQIKRQERQETMERVKRIAYDELRKNLDSANEELRRQIEYRNTLTNQIRDNQNIMELELNEIERKQHPFTKKSVMFKEIMKDKVSQLSLSENPVHPFTKTIHMDKVVNKTPSLPLIYR